MTANNNLMVVLDADDKISLNLQKCECEQLTCEWNSHPLHTYVPTRVTTYTHDTHTHTHTHTRTKD